MVVLSDRGMARGLVADARDLVGLDHGFAAAPGLAGGGVADLRRILGGQHIQFLRPSIYQEPINWAFAQAMAFVFLACGPDRSKEASTVQRCAWMALCAGLALLTACRSALGFTLRLDCAAGAMAAARMAGAGLHPAAFVVMAGIVNQGRWGDPLTFADFSRFDLSQDADPDRLGRLAAYGTFNLARIWLGLSYYFVPIWVWVRADGHVLFAETQATLMDAMELPPGSFFVTDPLLIGPRRRRVRLRSATASGPRCCWACAYRRLLMLCAISMAHRYRMEFYPMLFLAALFGVQAASPANGHARVSRRGSSSATYRRRRVTRHGRARRALALGTGRVLPGTLRSAGHICPAAVTDGFNPHPRSRRSPASRPRRNTSDDIVARPVPRSAAGAAHRRRTPVRRPARLSRRRPSGRRASPGRPVPRPRSSAPVRDGQPVEPPHARIDRHGLAGNTQPRAADFAVAHQPRRDPDRGIDADRETNPLRRTDHRGVDARPPFRPGDQRPAGVAGVQRRVRLDHAVDQAAGPGPQRPPRADTMPAVTVQVNPKGLPIATTIWPTRKSAERPSSACGKPLAASRSTAISVTGSPPTRVASTSRPSVSEAVIRAAFANDVMVGQHIAVRRKDHARSPDPPDADRRACR